MFPRQFTRRNSLIVLFLRLIPLFCLATPGLALAEDYPCRPIIITIGAPPGAAAGIPCQIFADNAKKYLPNPQPILINYKPGAATAVGADYVLKKPADGYNLFLNTLDLAVKLAKDGHLLSFKKEDFIPIGVIGISPALFTVNNESPYKRFEDFVDSAKKDPGKLSYGSVGFGTATHLTGEILQMRCGIKLNHVPLGGGAPVVAALLGRHIDCCFQVVTTVHAHIQPGGGLRALAVFAHQRFPELPDVPTILEKGYDIERCAWHYLTAPKGIPQEVLDILRKVFKKTLDDPQVKTALIKVGYIPVNWSLEETTKRFNEEFELAREIFKKLGLLQ